MRKEELHKYLTCGFLQIIKHLFEECRHTEVTRTKLNIPEFLHQSLG